MSGDERAVRSDSSPTRGWPSCYFLLLDGGTTSFFIIIKYYLKENTMYTTRNTKIKKIVCVLNLIACLLTLE